MVKKIGTGLGTLLIVTASFLGSAQSAVAEFNVCNETGEKIWIAIAYHENGIWSSKGWYAVSPTECRPIHSSLQNTRFYLYADGESNKVWKANHPFCVHYGNGFDIRRADDISSCAKVRNFFSVWVPDPRTGQMPSSYTYTFGPNTVNLNNPRAER